jgi:hypothetical protein
MSSSDKLRQVQQYEQSGHTPTGLRLNPRKAMQEELVQISPVFQILQQQKKNEPSPAQWREFSRKLTEKLDRQAEKQSRFRVVQVIRDRFTATDSVALRAAGYVLLIAALAVIAAGLWAAASFAMSGAPAHTQLLQTKPRTVLCATIVVNQPEFQRTAGA